LALPKSIIQHFGYALALAQEGKKHEHAKPLKGFGGAGVLEVVENSEGDTYRAVYSVRFADCVFVLHCFQKKSKRGAATPKEHIDIIRERLKQAKAIFEEIKK
jgi:phage-related protein